MSRELDRYKSPNNYVPVAESRREIAANGRQLPGNEAVKPAEINLIFSQLTALYGEKFVYWLIHLAGGNRGEIAKLSWNKTDTLWNHPESDDIRFIICGKERDVEILGYNLAREQPYSSFWGLQISIPSTSHRFDNGASSRRASISWNSNNFIDGSGVSKFGEIKHHLGNTPQNNQAFDSPPLIIIYKGKLYP